MLDPESDWRLVRPEVENLEKAEAAGWQVLQKFDIVYRNGRFEGDPAIGSCDPTEKVARLVEYFNEELGIFAASTDFFDQGVKLIIWFMEREPGWNSPQGVAILKDVKWRVKQLDEFYENHFEGELVKDRMIAVKVEITFKKLNLGVPVSVAHLAVERDMGDLE